MVDFYPFKAIRYGIDAGLMSDLICPPYDVISQDQEAALLRRNPNNMVRLELSELGSKPQANRYSDAASAFQKMQDTQVLVQDETESYYILRQKFLSKGFTKERIAILGVLRLEELGENVLPHENTAPGPKEDRLALMQATNANFSPLMMLYQDPDQIITTLIKSIVVKVPTADFIADDIGYTLWTVTAQAEIDLIRGVLEKQQVYVADGHHRYETALIHAKDAASTKNHPANFMLTALIDFEDEGLEILPYYRVIHSASEAELKKIRELLNALFVSRPLGIDDYSADVLDSIVATIGQNQVVLGVVEKNLSPVLLTPANDIIPEPDPDATPQTQARSVEAFVIQEMILKPVFGENFADHVLYVHEGEEAIDIVNSGAGQVAFFIKGLPSEVFQAVVQAGIRLPRKSTYFSPKLPSGIAINSLADLI